MTTKDEARQALLDSITAAASGQRHPVSLVLLAEAWAWVTSPDQPHGGQGNTK